MSNEPLHIQAYHAVLETQANARRDALAQKGDTGTYAPNSHPACIGAVFGLMFFAAHFAKDMDRPLMVIGVPIGGVIVGGIIGVAVSRVWRLFKRALGLLFRGIGMLFKGL